MTRQRWIGVWQLALLTGAWVTTLVFAHGVADSDKAFIANNPGVNIIPYIYLGAKHMVTGYDHLLFLVGVIFFLYRLKDVGVYVTLFALGHSTTLIAGVYFDLHASSHIVDAIIGLSVVYKALDNLGAYPALLGWQPNTKAAVLIFGFFHGFGLATKLQDLAMSREGLLVNLVSFNIGVEAGQLIALSVILLAMSVWRTTASFGRSVVVTNTLLMCAGLVLVGFQMCGYFVAESG